MKAVVKTTDAGTLREALHKHLRRVDLERPAVNLHASDVTREEAEFCPRAPTIKVRNKVPPSKREVITSMAVTWEWGRLVEQQVREWFAEMGMAVGDWECRHDPCGRMFTWQKRPKVCRGCGGVAFKYHERRAISAVSGIGCGIDLLVDYGENLLRLVEVKSIDKEKFAELAMAKAEHKLRTQLYLRCMAESDDPVWERVNRTRARVLYVTKGGFGVKTPEMGSWSFADGGFSPFKEYVIDRDDAEVEYLVQRAMQARIGMSGGAIPDKIAACKGGLASKRAQLCDVNMQCFKMKAA